MAFEMDWSPDYCLSCDRQTSGGAPYCSQSCRLADLESKSSPTSPTLLDRSSLQMSPSPLELSSGFQLPLAYNFSIHRSAASTARARPTPTTKTTVFSTTAAASTSPSRGLVSSGSQTSLSSLRSSSSTESFTLSDKTRSELRDYASAFDQVRNWKRKVTHS